MNIGYFNARGINDVEHWFTLEIEELRRRGYDVRVFTLRDNHPTRDDVDWMDFAHYHFAQVGDYFKRLGIPFCVSPHANDIFRDNGRTLCRASNHPKCKFVTYQSFYHKHKFEEWGIKKPLVYLPMCCRVDLFRRLPTMQLTGTRLVAGGRLIPKKGLERIIHLDNLTIFGDGPLKDKLQKMNPRAEFVGWLTDEELRKCYDRGWIFLNPSVVTDDGDSDGIPNTIKEAMLMELNVISSSVAGIPELENISLLDDWSKIDDVLESMDRTPNKKGKWEIQKTYSPKACVDRLLKGIEEYD